MYDHHYKEKKNLSKNYILGFKKYLPSKKNILNRGLTVIKGEITLVLFK
jgi:hypothetical protein